MRENEKNCSIKNLSKQEVEEVVYWKELTEKEIPSINKNGLWMLVERAMEEYSSVAKYNFGAGYLPWNLMGCGPWENFHRWRNYSQSDALPRGYYVEGREKFANCGDLLSYAARFAGWLREVCWLRGIVKVIAANTGSGMGSPYTTVNLYKLFEQWPSPHRLERQVWKVRDRANVILAPYGLSVSWSALGQAMVVRRQVGKAAIWAAEETVRRYLEYYDSRFQYYKKRDLMQERFFYLKTARGLREMKNFPDTVQRWAMSRCLDGEFGSLREALAVSDRLRYDTTDGVEMLVDPRISQLHGVEIRAGWVKSRGRFGNNGRLYLLRQVRTGRTYHADSHLSPREAVKRAIGAWRRQAVLEAKEADLIGFLQGKWGYSPLVYRGSSYKAGNCQAGTEAWLKRQGWSGRKFIPGIWLIPHLGENLVKNTAMALMLSFPKR